MSPLLPLIVLSIAFLHCAQAVDPKCQTGKEVYSSAGEKDSTQPEPQGAVCLKKCSIALQRNDPELSKYAVYYGCYDYPRAADVALDQLNCFSSRSDQRLTCFCDPVADSICNTPKLMFDEEYDEAHKHRSKLAREIGLNPQSLDGKVSFKWLDFKCQKWTVTYTVTDDKFEEKEIDKQDVEGCPGNLCFTSISRDSGAKTKSVKSGCYTPGRRTQVKMYDHETKDDSIDVYCFANTDKPCNTLDLMFLSSGDAELIARVAALKDKAALEVEKFMSNGKKIVDFKWRNCMNYQYEFSLKGETKKLAPQIKAKPCKSGVCIMTVTRWEEKDHEKIIVNAGCVEDPEEPLVTDIKCRTTLEELTSRCWCPAKKVSCNQHLNLFDTIRKDQRIRRKYLGKIGIQVEITDVVGNTASGEFKYDEDYGTTAPEEIGTVSGETTIPVAATARPPSAMPEDDPHCRELEGSATELSLTFAVLFSILRLI